RKLLSEKNTYSFEALGRKDFDISNLHQVESVMNLINPDFVINAAAYNFVDKAETDRDAAIAGNERGPENLAKVTFRKRIPLVHVSTDYVFDGEASKPYVESDDTNPISFYGKTKLEGEKLVTSNNFHSYIVRTAWVFSTSGKNLAST